MMNMTDKIKMLTLMTDRIKADPALDVSDWKNTLHFKAGELEKMELENLNEIEIEGLAEPEEGDLSPVEMTVVAVSQCYAITLYLQAHNEGISLDEVTIIYTGKSYKAPFLSIREGNSGLFDSKIELSVVSSAEKEKIAEIAKRSMELAPVPSSLKEPIELVIK